MGTNDQIPFANRLHYALETVQAWKEDVAEQQSGAFLSALTGDTDPDVGEYMFRLDALDVAETLIKQAMKKDTEAMESTTPRATADLDAAAHVATLNGMLTDILAGRADPDLVSRAAADALDTLDELAARLGGGLPTNDAADRARCEALRASATMRLRMVETLLGATLVLTANVAEAVERECVAASSAATGSPSRLDPLEVRAARLDTLIRKTHRELGDILLDGDE